MKNNENINSKIINNYEYAIERIPNSVSGSSNLDEMMKIINEYAEEGWKVHTVYSNELGKNAISVVGFGVNSTYSEDIIIFERHVQYNVALYEEKDLLVLNYSEDFPIRLGTMHINIPNNADYLKVSLRGKINEDINIDALKIDIDFITIFDEIIHVKNASFICVDRVAKDFNTEFYEIEMNKNTVRLIKAAKIYINAYVENGKAVITESLSYTDISENDVDCYKKNIYGQDYVGEFESYEESWKCVCGKINPKIERVCCLCGRSFGGLKITNTNDLQIIYDEAVKRESAAQILEYINAYNKDINSDVLSAIIKDLTMTASLEKLYGNNKTDAIRILKKYINVDDTRI